MKKVRVQIVEDESLLAKDIRKQLEKLDYLVVSSVSSGKRAIQIANDLKPDIVLMDIRIKGEIDGIHAANQIRKKFSIPVIYITAYSDNETLKRARVTEPFGYLIKPFEARELDAVIKMALYKHQMEQKLKQNEALFSSMLRSIGDGVIATDDKRRITFMNPVSERLIGWTIQEAEGKKLEEIYFLSNEKSGETIQDQIDQVLEKGKNINISNRKLLTNKIGLKIPVDQSIDPIKDDQGNIIGSILIFQDITERKKMEDQMRKLAKFQIFGQLASGVAHEVRNPLNAILAVTEALVEELGNNFEYKTYLGHIRTQVDRLSSMMKDLLDLGRPLQPSSFQPEPLKGICKAALNLWKQTTEYKNHQVKFSEPPDKEKLYVMANSAKLQQVFFNLLENAAQHSPEKSMIEIQISEPEKGKIFVQIIDVGCGVPEKNLVKIFEPFFTTRRGGIGFGLSIVKHFVELHKGSVEIWNNLPPPGCTVKVLFPLIDENSVIEEG